MGQYWIPVNLDKREFVLPHKLATGLKLWEQLANYPGTGAALIILTAAMPEARGGGDLDLEENWHGPEREDMSGPGPMPEDYPTVANRTIGRWAGDRIAIVGDYAERGDLAPEFDADLIYSLCCTEKEFQERLEWFQEKAKGGELVDKAERIAKAQPYRDITDDVCAVIEHELKGKFVNDGWRRWVSQEELPQYVADKLVGQTK